MNSNPSYLFKTRGASLRSLCSGNGQSLIDSVTEKIECADTIKSDVDLIQSARSGAIQVDREVFDEMYSSIDDEAFYGNGKNHSLAYSRYW